MVISDQSNVVTSSSATWPNWYLMYGWLRLTSTSVPFDLGNYLGTRWPAGKKDHLFLFYRMRLASIHLRVYRKNANDSYGTRP